MKCPNCDKEIPSEKKFCGFCGAKLNFSIDSSLKFKQPDVQPEDQNQFQEDKNELEEELSSIKLKSEKVIDIFNEELSVKGKRGTEKPKRKRKRLILAILIPILVIALIVTAVLLWIRETNKHLSSLTPPETDGNVSVTESNKDFITVVPPEEEERASVEVSVHCEDSLGEDVNFVTTVREDQDVVLKFGWLAITSEQVQDYIDNVDHTVYLDDEIVSNSEMGSIEPFTGVWPTGYPEVDESYVVNWTWDVGQLSLGSHRVSFIQFFNANVFDGVETYEAGEEWESGCDIIVE